MQLRDYQHTAVEAALEAVAQGLHPVISLPTGSGKALVAAELCRRLAGRILQTTHVKELLQQNYQELQTLDPSQDIGLYSAGLDRREIAHRIIIGGVQSIHHRMAALQQPGPFDYILIDECHRTPHPGSNEASMYARVFAACPQAQRIGLSATPYRLDDGNIFGDNGEWFNVLCHHTGMKDLVPEYLAPLRGILTAHNIDTAGVRTRQGEFVMSDLTQLACEERLVEATLSELCWLARKREHWLVFGVDVQHTELIAEKLNARGISTAVVTGNTPSEERAATLEAFKQGRIRAVANCQVLTTGFNAPMTDCIVVLRPTMSKALFVQMLGRGSRKAEAKKDCAVIDYGGNLERFIPLDAIHDYHKSPERLAKEEEEEKKQRQPRAIHHGTQASDLDPMADDTPTWTVPVQAVYYKLRPSKHPQQQGKTNLEVLYKLRSLTHKFVSSFVCLEYTGGARFHAAQWFKRRGMLMPSTAVEALRQSGRYAVPQHVVIRQEGRYMRVVVEQFATDKED